MQTILPNSVLTRFFTKDRSRPQIRRTELSSRGLLTETFSKGGGITCVRGSLWITRNGQPEDILLRAGDRLTCGRRSGFVIEALEDAVVEVVC
ncbi:DUF2917 domain-containing protein [Luteolibacter yonseiensis]|uniref:DUF2917 domain-containing protein n=1 Tax=Luteolibacter yonseiensis TaxID=1144680 RepID=A0A934VA97_9BACT|nr:DUF2917 domain-containing protein [Luteolibacter yonseiensis]MBK1814925.1 DUF2917 domain-containing protein [Luteolibacter yonseiensis]